MLTLCKTQETQQVRVRASATLAPIRTMKSR